MSEADAEGEVGDLAWLSHAEILRRASRTMHEQNAALHTCGEPGQTHSFPCSAMLKQPDANGAEPRPPPPGSYAGKMLAGTLAMRTRQEGTDSDVMARLVHGATRALRVFDSPMATCCEEVGEDVSVLPPLLLRQHHARGLPLPLFEVQLSVVADVPSFLGETHHVLRLCQLQRPSSSGCPSLADAVTRRHHLHVPCDGDRSESAHFVLPLSMRCAATRLPGGAECVVHDVAGSLHSPSTLSHFLYALSQPAQSTLTCFTAWTPPVEPAAFGDVQDVARAALSACTESRLDLFGLLPASSLSAVRPRCTRWAPSGLRPLSARPLFSSSVVVVLEGRLAWLALPLSNAGKLERIANALSRTSTAIKEEKQPDVDEANGERKDGLDRDESLISLLGQALIDPAHLIANGIPVQVAHASATQAVVADGSLLCCGAVLGGAPCSVVELSFLPASWLQWAPQRCLRWMGIAEACLVSASSEAVKAELSAGILRLFPDELVTPLLPRLVQEIHNHLRTDGSAAPSAVDLGSLPHEALVDAADALQRCTVAWAELRSHLVGAART